MDNKNPTPTLTEMPAYIKEVYNREGLVLFLKGLGLFCTLITVAAFAYVLIASAIADILLFVKLVIVTLVPFVGVTVFRHMLRAPRPCELYDMSSLGKRAPQKSGKSFPSRHVFSSFVIGTSLCFVEPLIGSLVLLFGITLGACRVLLGYHFLRDVVAGGIIGVVCGTIGMVIVNIC